MLARRTASLATLTLLFASIDACAQDTTTTSSTAWLVGVGVNASTLPYTGPSALLGREWRAPGARFGVRLTGDFTSTQNEHPFYPGYFVDGSAGVSRTHTRDYTLGVAASYALTRGRIQPYLLSGFIFQLRDISTQYAADAAVPTTFGLPNRSASYRDTGGGFGMQSGVGLSARIGGATVFAEARVLVPMGNRQTLVTSTPLMLGIRL